MRGSCVTWAQPPYDHVFVMTYESKAAAAARLGAAWRAGSGSSCWAGWRGASRAQTWLQAGKYVSALASELPAWNGWRIAEHAGDRAPDRLQRLLNRASWDELAAMSEVRRFAAAGLEEAARGAAGRPG